jgi:uncharacterized membrane protein AbrB (regulator of aidB expression)
VEGFAAAAFLLGPLILAVVCLQVSPRRRWVRLVLAAPAILLGLAMTAAVARDGPGYAGGWVALLYGPVLLVLGGLAARRWMRHRSESPS